MFFELKCVLAVCVHNHPIMIKKNLPSVFCFKSPKIITPFSDQAVLRFLAVWRHTDPGPSPDCWLTLVFYLLTCHEWAVYSPTLFSTPEQGQTRMTPKKLRYFVVGCNNEHSSRRLLPTSEPMKTQWINITFVFEGNAPPDLLKCIYVCANHSWSSFTYRINDYKVFLWIFANRLS